MVLEVSAISWLTAPAWAAWRVDRTLGKSPVQPQALWPNAVPNEVPNAAPNQVAFDTLMVGNLAEKSLALTAIFTATWRATAL